MNNKLIKNIKLFIDYFLSFVGLNFGKISIFV